MNLQITEMIVDSSKLMCFNGNETESCVIDSIFSGNDQQKVYYHHHHHPSLMMMMVICLRLSCTTRRILRALETCFILQQIPIVS